MKQPFKVKSKCKLASGFDKKKDKIVACGRRKWSDGVNPPYCPVHK